MVQAEGYDGEKKMNVSRSDHSSCKRYRIVIWCLFYCREKAEEGEWVYIATMACSVVRERIC